jgi:hypothetical protein
MREGDRRGNEGLRERKERGKRRGEAILGWVTPLALIVEESLRVHPA